MAKRKRGALFSNDELLKILDTAVDKAVEEKIKPRVKATLQKHIKDEVVDKDFVDKKGGYRKYRYIVNGRSMTGVAGHASKYDKEHNIASNELGHGRTQTAKYTHMADDKYIETTPFENDKFLTYNIMPPPGHSIFGTTIKNINDPLLYTKWIVEGDIVMPTLKPYTKEEWNGYVKKPENRYEARPFVDHAAETIKKDMQKYSDDLTETIQEEMIKAFKNMK